MDEKEVLLAMKRLRKIEEEARRRLIKEKEDKEKAKTGTVKKENTKPKPVPKVETAKVKSAPKVEAFKPKPKVEVAKPKKTAIPAAIKTLVWNKWIGEKVAEAGCYACKVTTITMRHHHTGHVISEKHGGGCTIDNLRPVCGNCNLSMGTMDMNEYIKKFGLHK